jgi:voltage-gated potassium channel Kch
MKGAGQTRAPKANEPRAPVSGTRPTLRQRLRYAFDNTMSRGTPALVGWLGVATLALITVFTLVVLIADLAPGGAGGRPGTVDQFFKDLLHAIDPGTIAGDTGDWQFLLAMLLLTFGGLLIVSALIGVLATGLDAKLQDLRKGRSFVIERDHTLILGWSDTVYTILEELAIANENEKDPCIVILADRDKVEMEDLIRAKVGDTGRTRVVCRSGSPIDLVDLDLVNPREARSIVVLAPEGDEPDTQVIKVILALTKGEGHRDVTYHVVAEIHDPSNLDIARMVGGDEVVLIDKRQTIARLVVQAARQSGVSVVYTELLDFGGDEVYFRHDPALEGKTFGDALLAYEECAVIGLRNGGGVDINPPMDTTIGPGDQVIAIAGDDEALIDAAAFAGSVDEGAVVDGSSNGAGANRTLILGWNRQATTVINELDEFAAPGSKAVVLADGSDVEKDIASDCASLDNLRVTVQAGSTGDRERLEALATDGVDHVIVLCYSERFDVQTADARTLVTLLHLRDIAERTGAKYTIVSEMLDDRNRQLAEVTRVDDVIVSNKLLSLMLAQISENSDLNEVFLELFGAEGSEIYLRPAAGYVRPGQATSFADLVESARRRGEVAIGFRRAADAWDSEKSFGVVINPPKSEPVMVGEADTAIVLAES